MRDRGSRLATMPLAAVFIGVGVASIKHEVGFTVVCFLAALLLLVPGTVATIVDHAENLTGMKCRVAMSILGALGLVARERDIHRHGEVRQSPARLAVSRSKPALEAATGLLTERVARDQNTPAGALSSASL